MEWQPIETAPKDGTQILLYAEQATVDLARLAFWNDGAMWDSQGFNSQEQAVGWWSYRNCVAQEKITAWEPTHWAPFRAPEETP